MDGTVVSNRHSWDRPRDRGGRLWKSRKKTARVRKRRDRGRALRVLGATNFQRTREGERSLSGIASGGSGGLGRGQRRFVSGTVADGALGSRGDQFPEDS